MAATARSRRIERLPSGLDLATSPTTASPGRNGSPPGLEASAASGKFVDMAGQLARRAILRNPFFAILLAISTLFVLTVLGYLVSPYVLAPRLAPQRQAAGSLALAGWLDRNGPDALGVEFIVMLLAGVLAMATEDKFSSRSKPPDVQERS